MFCAAWYPAVLNRRRYRPEGSSIPCVGRKGRRGRRADSGQRRRRAERGEGERREEKERGSCVVSIVTTTNCNWLQCNTSLVKPAAPNNTCSCWPGWKQSRAPSVLVGHSVRKLLPSFLLPRRCCCGCYGEDDWNPFCWRTSGCIKDVCCNRRLPPAATARQVCSDRLHLFSLTRAQ